MVANISEGERNALDRGVVRFSAAAREHNLADPTAEGAGDDLSGLINGLPGLLGDRVDAGRVAEADAEVRIHCVQHFFPDGGGSRVVQIDQLVRSRHDSMPLDSDAPCSLRLYLTCGHRSQ